MHFCNSAFTLRSQLLEIPVLDWRYVMCGISQLNSVRILQSHEITCVYTWYYNVHVIAYTVLSKVTTIPKGKRLCCKQGPSLTVFDYLALLEKRSGGRAPSWQSMQWVQTTWAESSDDANSASSCSGCSCDELWHCIAFPNARLF